MMTNEEVAKLESMVADLDFCLRAVGPGMDRADLEHFVEMIVETKLMLKEIKESQAKMVAYQHLQDFLGGLEARKGSLRKAEEEIIADLAVAEAALDEAIVAGNYQQAQAAINKFKSDLATINRELKALDNPPPGGHLGKLRTDALNEIRENLADKRRFWQENLRPRLEAKKAEFMALVLEAGELNREGQTLVANFSSVQADVPGPKQGAPGFMSDIISRPDRHTGPIFFDHSETEKFFKGEK